MILSFILKILSSIFLFTGKIGNQNAFAKPLSQEEEKECFEKYRKGDKEAEEKLIKHNLRLVAHIVKKYANSNIDQDELISVGSIGLMKSIKSYDIEKGHSFSTYSARCIQNEILMLLRSQKKYNNEISIEDKIGNDKDGNDITLIDVLQDNRINIEDRVETNLLIQKIVKYIKEKMSPREQEILCLRYGLDGGVTMTQNEVAKILNISRSYISRIEKKCIEELRTYLIKG